MSAKRPTSGTLAVVTCYTVIIQQETDLKIWERVRIVELNSDSQTFVLMTAFSACLSIDRSVSRSVASRYSRVSTLTTQWKWVYADVRRGLQKTSHSASWLRFSATEVFSAHTGAIQIRLLLLLLLLFLLLLFFIFFTPDPGVKIRS